MIAPKKIRYRNKTNIDYDVIVDCSFGSGDSGETESYLNREAIITETYDGSYTRNHGYKYTDMLVATITFIKKDFEDFTPEENRRMLSWLTSARNAERLEIYHDDSEVLSYVLFGGFTSVQQYKMANSRVVGYVCEFTHQAPFVYSPTKLAVPTRTIVKELTPEPFYYQPITISCKTDEDEMPVYPKITITFDKTGQYLFTNNDPMDSTFEMMENVIYRWFNAKKKQNEYFVNIDGIKHYVNIFRDSIEKQKSNNIDDDKYYYCQDTDDDTIYKDTSNGFVPVATMKPGVEIRVTHIDDFGVDTTVKSTIIGCTYGEVIIIDGANRLIYSKYNNINTRIIGNDFNWEWPRFMYGENTISVVGNCDVQFEWVEPRKVGQL
jgi:sarcosine oxidase delta subunit